eukprot:CAMPEP_0202895264 /NCGR_PEP_ID=MMETSP1392-20130828/4505_1 /ASSEMBLY_ACC=CAM_ASM_000868 /TAXON_ID=225041 /ORGANISM="Chlamydomonas chlamydogama, Strain SAG 11-48b" /LENGTH=726 /DNA_ID=CAMNT_0049580213 /DNA_START=66 /DNA_END=2246 /DNA_ORIENTATION=+
MAAQGGDLLTQTLAALQVDQYHGGNGAANGFANKPLTMDEAKLILQNRQLMAQLQAHQTVARDGANGAKLAQQSQAQGQLFFKQPAGMSGVNVAQLLKPPETPQGAQALLNLQGQLQGLQSAAPQQRLQVLQPAPAKAGGNPLAAIMQGSVPQFYSNAAPGNQVYIQNNPIAAAAAAAAVAATQQAQAQARAQQAAQQQAQRAAAVAAAAAMLQNNHNQAAAQQVAALQRQAQIAAAGQANAAVNAQNAALVNAAMQRAAATGQLVLQNGKPVLLQSAVGPVGQQAAAQQGNVQLLQQLQAAAQAQAQAQKQAQLLNQLKAGFARFNAMKAAQLASSGYNPALGQGQQLPLQDMLASARVGGNGMQNAAAQNGVSGAQVQQVYGAAAGHHLQQQQHAAVAALAGLTPAQIQTLTANPALAQAFLQSRAQQQQQQAQAQRSSIGPAELLLSTLQQAKAQPAHGGAQAAQVAAANGMQAGEAGGAAPNTANKEQRRLALACVALQLARGGVSVEQAINSGIMGGMSVTDVRFIVECYNAERARMKELSGGPPSGSNSVVGSSESPTGKNGSIFGDGAPAVATTPPEKRGNLSVPGSPGVSSQAGSDAGSHRGSVISEGAAATATQAAAELLGLNTHEPLGDPNGVGFNAFSYDFFGVGNGSGGDLLEELEPGAGGDEALEGALEDLSWLPEAAAAGAGLGGALEDQQEASKDDLAARFDNLDLGAGFN